MNARTLIAGLAAGLVALGSFFGIRYMFLDANEEPPAAQPEPVAAVAPAPPAPPPDPTPEPVAEAEPEAIAEPEAPVYPVVLVATRDIQPGARLVRELVEWREWRERLDVNSALVENVTPIDTVLGTVARAHIPSGGLIEWSNLILPGRAGFMTSMLTPGYRAVTIEADRATSRANLIRPGDRVDVILVSSDGSVPGLQAFGPAAQAIARDVLVLAVGSMTLAAASYTLAQGQGVEGIVDQIIQEQPDGDTYTLEVPPEDAERVALASGMVTLALRSFRDLADMDSPPRLVGFDDVLDGLSDLEPDPLPPTPAVRIIRGRRAEVEEVAGVQALRALVVPEEDAQ